MIRWSRQRFISNAAFRNENFGFLFAFCTEPCGRKSSLSDHRAKQRRLGIRHSMRSVMYDSNKHSQPQLTLSNQSKFTVETITCSAIFYDHTTPFTPLQLFRFRCSDGHHYRVLVL